MVVWFTVYHHQFPTVNFPLHFQGDFLFLAITCPQSYANSNARGTFRGGHRCLRFISLSFNRHGRVTNQFAAEWG